DESQAGPGRLRAVEDFLGLIGQAADVGAIDPIQRGLVVNRIAKLLGIEREEIHQRLKALNRRMISRTAAPAGVPAESLLAADAQVMATRELLEVLINEPGYYPSLASCFDP